MEHPGEVLPDLQLVPLAPQQEWRRASSSAMGNRNGFLAPQQVSHLLMLHSGSILRMVGSSV